MSKVQSNALVQYLRRLAEGQAGASERTDRELLRLYASDHNEAAFFSLVRRYGPMVWKLCGRTLRSEQDAEDAFQATFMVLAQKAGSVGWHESIASWLFAVARCIARKARGQAASHRAAPSADPVVPDPLETMSARELLLALDEELASLPEKYRGPLILHFLEGKTLEETAGLLGVSLSSVRRRLEQGRKLLHARLAGRGFVFSGALLATAVLSQNAATASAPLALIGSTIQAASAMARGEMAVAGVASARATALAEGVVKAMFMTKLRIAIAMLLLAGTLGLGAVAGVVEWTRAAEPARDPLAVLAGGKLAKEPEKKPRPDADAGMEPTGDASGPVPKPKDGPLGMTFVPLPKGTFYMGWNGEKGSAKKTEIKEDFEIAIHTVTQGQWQEVMGKNPSYFSRGAKEKDKVKDIKDEDLKQFPVENVSWEDAQEFIKKLNEKEKGRGYLYRLPSEAEWEYACRGGATSEEECSYHFYFDKPTNDLSSKQANFNGNTPFGKGEKGPYLGRPAKVGSYAPNKRGLYDMHGNVWQWCEDLFKGSDRVLRGGCWLTAGTNCQAANRGRGTPAVQRQGNVGFRLARVPVR